MIEFESMTRRRKTVWITILLPIVYAASFGPAIGCVRAARWHEGRRLLEIVYAPIYWVEPYCSAPLANAIGSYILWCVLIIKALWPVLAILAGPIVGAFGIRAIVRWRNRRDDPKRLTAAQ